MTVSTSFAGRWLALRGSQKPRSGVPLYTFAVNRPIGRAIAAVSPAWVTPDALTGIGAVLTYASLVGLMVVPGAAPLGILVGAGLIVGFFFDSADGQLARLRAASSLSGEWLDHVLDCGRIVLMHIATLWFFLRTGIIPSSLAVVACTLFAVAAAAVFFAGTLFEKLTPQKTVVDKRPSRRTAFRSALMLPVDYGVICWAYLLLPTGLLFVAVYLLLGTAKLLSTAYLLSKWYRALRSVDRQRTRTSA